MTFESPGIMVNEPVLQFSLRLSDPLARASLDATGSVFGFVNRNLGQMFSRAVGWLPGVSFVEAWKVGVVKAGK